MKYSASMDFLFLKPSVDRMESTGASAGSYLYAHARCVIMHASVCVCVHACVCVCHRVWHTVHMHGGVTSLAQVGLSGWFGP